MERLEHIPRPRIIIRKLLNHLVRRRLTRAISRIARLRDLPGSGRNVHHRLRLLGRQGQVLRDDVPGSKDVGLEGAYYRTDGDVLCRDQIVAGRGVGD